MAQVQRGKSPLDVLQSMINAILIETGKALRASNKESGKSLANVNTRLRTTIPSTIENFHQALDELECDITRAKSVLLRDLEELRAKRIALENPEPIIEEIDTELDTMADDTDLSKWAMESVVEAQEPEPSPPPPPPSPPQTATVKQEDRRSRSPEKQAPATPAQPAQSLGTAQVAVMTNLETNNENTGNNQGPTPPSSVPNGSKPIDLENINTEVGTEGAPASAEQDHSAIDSLFGDNNGGSDLMNFDDEMDFLQESSTIPQSNEQSQPQNDEFDLSNFGSTSQDFSMVDLHTSTQPSTANNESANKQDNDILSMTNTQSADIMDLEFDLGGEENSFNDMFIDAENDLNHELDASFFES